MPVTYKTFKSTVPLVHNLNLPWKFELFFRRKVQILLMKTSRYKYKDLDSNVKAISEIQNMLEIMEFRWQIQYEVASNCEYCRFCHSNLLYFYLI